MDSYLNKPKLKELAIDKLKNAIINNTLVQRKLEPDFHKYWENGKGTVIGCISELNEIEDISKMFGIPAQLLLIQDHIFQFLKTEKAQQFGLKFLEAIPIGVDLHFVWKKYFIWLLIEVDSSTMDALKHIPLAKNAIEQAVETLQEMLVVDIPNKKLDGIIKNINASRQIVGRAADEGSLKPEYAGWELAKAHWALQSYSTPSFVTHILPQGGVSTMWEFLADQLIEIITKGKTSRNFF